MFKILYITNQINDELINQFDTSDNIIIFTFLKTSKYHRFKKLNKNIKIFNFFNDKQEIKKINLNGFYVVEELFNNQSDSDHLSYYYDFIQFKFNTSKIKNITSIISHPYNEGYISSYLSLNYYYFFKINLFFNDLNCVVKRYFFNPFKSIFLSPDSDIDNLCTIISKKLLVREKMPDIEFYPITKMAFIDEKIAYNKIINSLKSNNNFNYKIDSNIKINFKNIISEIFSFIDCHLDFSNDIENFKFTVSSSDSDEFRLPKNTTVFKGKWSPKPNNSDFLIKFDTEKIQIKTTKKYFQTYLRNLFLKRLKDTRVSEFNFMIDSIPPSEAS